MSFNLIVPGFTNPVPISSGGTGATTVQAAIQAMHTDGTSAASVRAYPTRAGIYRTIGINIFSHLPAGISISNYGVLVINKASEYDMHIYVDNEGKTLIGYSTITGSTAGVTEPASWRYVLGVKQYGSSGIWKYTVYGDHTAECWGSLSVDGTPTESWGSLYVLPLSIPNYPVTFINYPVVEYSYLCNSNTIAGAWVAAYNGTDVSMQNPGKLAIVRPTSLAVSGALKIYVRGIVS